ncbi:MAG: hypothetical protein WD771_08795 [Gemmatimonadaceae bacterium]
MSPEFFANYELYEAEAESGLPVRVTYAGLWTVADRRGIFPWSRNLKPSILPYDAVDILSVLAALECRGFVRKYSVEGAEYGIIPSFGKHQTFHHAEQANKNWPAPPDGDKTGASPRQDGGQPEASPTVTVTAPSTVAVAAPTTKATTGTTRKKRESAHLALGSDAAQSAPRPDTWLTPIGAVWESRYDRGSFPYGQAAAQLKPLLAAGHSAEEIARRLDWYLSNKGSEHVEETREQFRRRNFTPSLKDFRLRFGKFDPSAPVEEAA